MRAVPMVMAGALLALSVLPAAAQDAAQGEQLFAQQRCSICHSVAGKGNTKFPLDNAGSRLTPDVVELWLTDPKAAEAKTGKTGTPKMRSYAKLSADEIAALVAYVMSLK
ncbi:MAG: cytochrome c [Vicinamibacterales bacterium]